MSDDLRKQVIALLKERPRSQKDLVEITGRSPSEIDDVMIEIRRSHNVWKKAQDGSRALLWIIKPDDQEPPLESDGRLAPKKKPAG